MIVSDTDMLFLAGAILVALIARRNTRGVLWIGVAALSYINGDIAWRLDLPYAEAITGLGDAGVCLAVYFFGRWRWEMLIWRLYQTSVLISMLYLAGNIGVFLRIPHDVYSILMETVNVLLLLLILGMSIAQQIGATDVGARWPWNRVRRFAFFVSEKRARPSFHEVP